MSVGCGGIWRVTSPKEPSTLPMTTGLPFTVTVTDRGSLVTRPMPCPSTNGMLRTWKVTRVPSFTPRTGLLGFVLSTIQRVVTSSLTICSEATGSVLHSGTGGLGSHLPASQGALIRKFMEDWMREEFVRRGYLLVYTPHVMRRELWKVSGHDEVYSKDMFPPMKLDNADYRLKPMNCPGHILIYKNSPKSYRDLPQRYAEFGNVYRYERSGTMPASAVRGFTQDDAHIFCTPEQIEGEVHALHRFCRGGSEESASRSIVLSFLRRDPNKAATFVAPRRTGK